MTQPSLEAVLARNPANFAANAQPVEILDVGTGEPTGLVIHVFSKDHPNFKAEELAFQRLAAERLAKQTGTKRMPFGVNETKRHGARLTAAAISHTNNPEFPGDLDARAALLLENDWIVDQLDAKLMDRAAFMKPPAKA